MEWLLVYFLMYRNENDKKLEPTSESALIVCALVFSFIVSSLKSLQLMDMNGVYFSVFQGLFDIINTNGNLIFPLASRLLMLMIFFSMLTIAFTVKGLFIDENEGGILSKTRRLKANAISLIVLLPNLFWFV